MMIQMHNERSNEIGLDRDLELIWRWLKWNQEKEIEEMTKRSWKTMFFNFAWTCEKFAQSCEMDQRGIWLQLKGKKWKLISHDHAKILHNHAKCSKKAKIVLMNFPLRTIMRNCWNSCKIAFFYRFLGEEAFERPFRWCQVSTWPWPINRNLIYSFWKDIYISNRRTFQISSLYRIFYFPSFSLIFSLTKHVLWDQISKYEWLNLVFLEGGKI